jgi:hypothetical protein
MSETKLSLAGNNYSRLGRVTDIPAGDGKIANFFYSVCTVYEKSFHVSIALSGMVFFFLSQISRSSM